jgi:glycosyltransferase involved in cell wall biosynthesis
MVRVLMLFTILNRGGAETMVMNYYRNIDRTKVQFDFVVHREERGAYEDEIEQLGGRIYRFEPLRPWTIPQYKKQIKQFFDEHPEYKIIHGHCSESGYYFYKEASKRGVPVIIAHAHNSKAGYDLKWPFRTYMKYMMRPFITHQFTCGTEAAQWLFGNERAKKATLQHNAIDTKEFQFSQLSRVSKRTELGISEDTLVLGHIGRFEQQKNHFFVVKVFQQLHARHSNSLLLLIGSGGDKEKKNRQLVADLHLESFVMFLGSRNDVPHLLHAMDVFLFPSFMEGFPLSLLEAQCSGLPCVVSEGVPQETCITNLVTRLSLKESAEQWAKTIIRQSSFSNDRADYTRQIAEAGYDIKKNAQWLQDFYLSCLS